jgi:uncharacterized membrane protein
VINYPVIRGIARHGAQAGLAVGYLAGAAQILAVLSYASHRSLWWLAFGAAAMALTNACIWSSQHLHISRSMDRATKSSSMATMEIIRQAVSVLAPLLGGLLAGLVGISWVLALAMVTALFAVAALRGVAKQPGIRGADDSSQPVKYDFSGAPARDIWANFCFNIDTAIGTLLWPVFLAVMVANYRGIGAISALAALAAMATVWLAGRRGDQGNDRSVLLQGIAASSAIHLLRLVATTNFTVMLLSAGYRSALAYFQNAWTSTYYVHAQEGGVAYIMSMEIACDLANIGLWLLLFALTCTVSNTITFNVCFVIAALAAWGCLLVNPQVARPTKSAVLA